MRPLGSTSFTFPRRILPFCILIAALPGCSTYQNVTAYFNTYYNAQKLFDDGVAELSRSQQAGKDTSYFLPMTVKSDGQSKFDKVIEKCSKIIQFYPDCKLVDDAVLLIGESDVYLGEYEAAIRKFNELLTTFPASDRRFEARLWCAKAEYYSDKDDDAVKLVEALVPEALDAGEDKIAIEAVMLEAQIYFNRGEYHRSAEQYERAAGISGPRSVRAIAQFQLGQSYERINENKKAAEAYLRVKDFKPEFDLRTRSQLRAGIMLVSVGEYETALNIYDDLKGDLYKPGEMAPVELEVATTYLAMSDTGRAFPLFQKVDTTYRHTEYSAKGYYRLAKYYEGVKDYKTAFDNYSRVQAEAPTGDIGNNSLKKARTYTNYFTLRNNVHVYDTLYAIALHRDTSTAGRDTLNRRLDSTGSRQLGLAALDSSNLRPAVTGLRQSRGAEIASATRGGLPSDQLRVMRHRSRGHNDFDDDEENEAMADSASFGGAVQEYISASEKLASDLKAQRSRLEQMRLSPDTLRALRTQACFELGGLYMLDLDLPDSAIEMFDGVVNDSVRSPLKPRALYALAEIHRSRNDSTIVDSLYHQILTQYDHTDYAREVRKFLNLAGSEAAIDSAESQYSSALVSLRSGKTDEAVRLLKVLSREHPSSPNEARVQYALGWIYENVLSQNDSAAAWYRRLVKRFPNSVYAMNVEPKVAVSEHPDSLSHFVNVKEIQSVAKEPTPKQRREGVATGQEKGLQQPHRGRGKEESVDEDSDEDTKEEEAPKDDDENSDNDDDNNQINFPLF